jgi:hypothetical protein
MSSSDSTRKFDLEHLARRRETRQTEEGLQDAEAALAAVFEQIKDPVLEDLRRKLIDVLKRLEQPLTVKFTPHDRNLAFMEYMELQRKAQEYSSTPEFRARIAQVIERQVNRRKANEFYFGKQKGGEINARQTNTSVQSRIIKS